MHKDLIIEWRNVPTNHNPTCYEKTSDVVRVLVLSDKSGSPSVKFSKDVEMVLPIGPTGYCVMRVLAIDDGEEKVYFQRNARGAGDHHISEQLKNILPLELWKVLVP